VQSAKAESATPLLQAPLEGEEVAMEEPLADDPIMLVAIQTAVRGIDLPSISHVFIAGVPESDVEYLHLAGRVGRLGAESTPRGTTKKVITFLPEPNLNPRTGGKKALQREKLPQMRLESLWNMIGIKPSYYGKAL
jgi:superfamily II DNA or RNA helicase